MIIPIDCPACGTNLNCSGCGEEVRNIVEQSSFLKAKETEIIELKKRIDELEAIVDKLKCCGNCKHKDPAFELCEKYCVRDLTSNIDRWEEVER